MRECPPGRCGPVTYKDIFHIDEQGWNPASELTATVLLMWVLMANLLVEPHTRQPPSWVKKVSCGKQFPAIVEVLYPTILQVGASRSSPRYRYLHDSDCPSRRSLALNSNFTEKHKLRNIYVLHNT